MSRYSNHLELSNYVSITSTRGRWLLIPPYNITYHCTVNVAIVKVRHEDN